MSEELVITAVGPDRPGIAAEFSGHVHEGGANLADSRMVNLRGRFAVVALVEGSKETIARTRETLAAAAKKMGLKVEFSESERSTPRGGVPFRLRSYSMDQPGIVHRVTSYLHEQGINIEELETRLESAPFMGTPVFTMELVMLVSQGVSVSSLRRSLEALGAALNCDIDLDPA